MNVVIAGGGTGGHLFPGIAIAREFLKQDAGNTILFIGSAKGIEARMLPRLNYNLKVIPVAGFKGKGPAGKARALLSVPAAFARAGYYLKAARADLVVGLGGYISFPPVAAAAALGIPAVIHEQNSVPGLANRMLGRLARRIFISYEESRAYFPAEKTITAGMPVRCLPEGAAPQRPASPLCVFVCGGSQGAHAVNEALIAALPHLDALKSRLRFIHQTGHADLKAVEQAYGAGGFAAQVYPFIDDMYACYGEAHVIISRAGASTLAEIALWGRASILIPYPFAAGNHQEHNARVFADSEAARMIVQKELSGEGLAQLLSNMEQHREQLAHMENRARLLAKPGAAETIVAACTDLAGGRKA